MTSSYPITEVPPSQFPKLLREIPQPPNTLTFRGKLPDPSLKLIAVVGSRKYTTYGKQVVEQLIRGLAGYPIGIVSGLALGIDSLAHENALQHNVYTLAVPGSGLHTDVIYPATHKPLARKILDHGGGLLSEFEPHFKATLWSFTKRNRIMAGIAHATLLIEASEKSGTLITARMAVDYNRELLVVPGSIFSHNSIGVHQFLKLGATPVTTALDILQAVGIDPSVTLTPKHTPPTVLTSEEHRVLQALEEPKSKDTLIRTLMLDAQQANTLLMHMEIKGLIANNSDLYRRL